MNNNGETINKDFEYRLSRNTLSLLSSIKKSSKRKQTITKSPSGTTRKMKYKHYKQSRQSNNTKLSKSKTKTHSTGKTYIDNFIDDFYDNDILCNKFYETAYKRQHIFPMPSKSNRVIVIGDIHGDLDVLMRCLILSGCVTSATTLPLLKNRTVSNMDKFYKSLKWVGGDTYLVQLGDQIDRVRPQNWDDNNISISDVGSINDEGCTLEIFYLFYYLDKLAREYGGRVFTIIGNHEIMNVEGDFRYVSMEEFKSFKKHLDKVYISKSKYPYYSRTLKTSLINKYNSQRHSYPHAKTYAKNHPKTNSKSSNKYSRLPDGYRERLYAFSPTGICANYLGTTGYMTLQIGQWLFCHGSPTNSTLSKYSIDLINTVISMYLLGIESIEDTIIKHYDILTNAEENKSSIIWDRTFGQQIISDDNSTTNPLLLNKLDTILENYNTTNNLMNNDNLKVKYVAIGHTPQSANVNGINSTCNGKVWRCDIGMSQAFAPDNRKKVQILEITGKKIQVLEEK